MKRLCALGVAAVLLLLCLRVYAGEYPAMPPEAEEALQTVLSRYDTKGACIAVFENGEITGVYCWGECRTGGPKVEEDTVFRVGSISKMVTAVGLMQLLESSQYTLESEIGDILGFPIRHPQARDVPVTLRQLLTHTAALRDGGDYQSAVLGDSPSLKDVFTSHSSYAFLSDTLPGESYHYSNFGGGLIGSLIESLSSLTLDEYMTEKVFSPLGVKAAYHSSLLRAEVSMADMYDVYSNRITLSLQQGEEAPSRADPLHDYNLSAGKLLISAPDLCKLLIALCDGGVYGNARLLRESTVEEMLTLQDGRKSVHCDPGCGLSIRIEDGSVVEGRELWGHGGKAYGMLCSAYFDPADRTGVVMLTNGCRNRSYINGVAALTHLVTTICYEKVINPGHVVRNPYEVE